MAPGSSGKLSGPCPCCSLPAHKLLHSLCALPSLLCAIRRASIALLPLSANIKIKPCGRRWPTGTSWSQSRDLGKVVLLAQCPSLVQCLWPRGKRLKVQTHLFHLHAACTVEEMRAREVRTFSERDSLGAGLIFPQGSTECVYWSFSH